jgi:hypothetical protein
MLKIYNIKGVIVWGIIRKHRKYILAGFIAINIES